MTIREIAQSYIDAGLSIIPIRVDGSKAPACGSWKQYQARLASDDEICQWFGNAGIAIIGGVISYGLEIIDFDDPSKLKPWRDLCISQGLGDALKSCAFVKTPSKGWHVYYRCETIEGNLKLAFNVIDGKQDVAIETRGEGGYVVAPGSPPACHSAGVPYTLMHGDLTALPMITPEQREGLHSAARSFNQVVPVAEPPRRDPPAVKTIGLTPGDDYDRRGDVRSVLSRHGWKYLSSDTVKENWCRPGKSEGISATLGHCSADGIPLFYVFSRNASPFEAEQSYGPFRVYCLLEHGGDGRAAFGALAREGYGDPIEFVRKVKQPLRPAYSYL